MAVGLTVLCALGYWQVQRLHWKEALISQVNARVQLEPVLLENMLKDEISREAHEYTPVKVAGTFDYSKEIYFFTTDRKGASGWNIHSPFMLDNGKVLIVNRGFVYFSEKDVEQRLTAKSKQEQEIMGLVRVPFVEKPGSFPDNNLKKREFYWRDLSTIYESLNIPQVNQVPVILDMNEIPVPASVTKEGWPTGGTTIISFTNNHLQYAVTWFGLALTLLGVGGFFLYSRSRATDDK